MTSYDRTCQNDVPPPARSIKTRPLTAVTGRIGQNDHQVRSRLARATTAVPQKRILSRQNQLEDQHHTREDTNNTEENNNANERAISRAKTLDLDYNIIDITQDDGWDTDLETDDDKRKYDGTSKALYKEACKKLRVIPASYFLRNMFNETLEMKHHGLGATGIKPLAITLVNNAHVLRLNLEDNWLGCLGGLTIMEMMLENCYITHLDLSSNRLGKKFAAKLPQVLSQNTTLTHLSLRGNDFDDLSARYIAEAIEQAATLEVLNLSHNQFSEKSGVILGPSIAENTSLKLLDLSWNALRRKGAVAIANGIKHNFGLLVINLSWNGFHKDGAKAIGDALKINSTLEELDVSNNRFTSEAAVLLSKGLAKNQGLKSLKIGQNPMQSAGCQAILSAIKKNPNSLIQSLDFKDIMVNADFGDVLTKVRQSKPELKLRTGCDGVPMKPKARVHPMVKLQNYINKHKLRLVDFFNRFDKDGSMSVTREEFQRGIEIFCQESGITLTEEEIVELIEDLDKDGDGEINYSELVVGHQDFSEKEWTESRTTKKKPKDDKVWQV